MPTNVTVCQEKIDFYFIRLIEFCRDHTDKVLCVQFNLDYIVSGSTDKTIKVKFKELKSK
jgi:hypothetical protein